MENAGTRARLNDKEQRATKMIWVKVFNGEEWVYKSLEYVTNMVSDNIKDNMEEWTEKYDKKLSPFRKRALNEFVSKCIEGKMETLFKDELKMFLMTYSNELKEFVNNEITNKLALLEQEEMMEYQGIYESV